MTRNTARIAGSALLLCAAAGPAWADERDDEIARLKRQVEDQAAEQARMRAQLDALIAAKGAPAGSALDAAIEDLSANSTPSQNLFSQPTGLGPVRSRLDLGGYFSTVYRNSEADDKYGSFVDSRLVFLAKADITRKISFSTEIEFEHGGISDEVDGEIVIEQASIRFKESDCFTFKAGTLLVPWGRFNLEHDDPLNELSSRPTVSRYINGAAFALPGIGVEGHLPGTESVALSYDFIVTNGLKDEITSNDGIRDARGLFEDDDNHGKTAFGRFGMVPDVEFVDALSLGASFAWGNIGSEGRGEHDLRGYGFDMAAKEGPWEMKGEWSHLGIDRADGTAPPKDAAGNIGPVRGLGGWYGQVAYRITDPWVRSMPFAEDSASVALVLRRDAVDLNDRVNGADERDDERAWSFGINYRPTTRTVIKLEYRKAESGFDGEEGKDRDLIALEFSTYF